MRSSKSRSRNRSNRQRPLGNVTNRVFDSSGPEGKVRGTPQQVIDKYLALARDAQLSSDRVAEQSFLQHAEHYTRLLSEAQREMAERNAARQASGQRNDGDATPRGRGDNRNDNRRTDRAERDSRNPDEAADNTAEQAGSDRQAGRDEGQDDQANGDNRRPARGRPTKARAEVKTAEDEAAQDTAFPPARGEQGDEGTAEALPGSSDADEAGSPPVEAKPKPRRTTRSTGTRATTTRTPRTRKTATKPAAAEAEGEVASGD